MSVDDPAVLSPRVDVALGAAQIPAAKLGAHRHARVAERERELYFWILRGFATRGRPSREATHAAAARLKVDLGRALETFAREDLVDDASGEIAVAYPFSGRPTAHRVRFASGHEAYAMCAIDALGIASMFDQPIAVVSRDPVSNDEINAWVTPNGDDHWRPETAVVVAGAIEQQDDACSGCCPALNFFASTGNAERWLDAHPAVRGEVISIPDAILTGRAVFGDVLDQG